MADDKKPAGKGGKHHGPGGVGTFFIVLIVLVIVGIICWIAFTQLRARRLGLPPPTLSSYIPFKSSSSSRGYPSPARGGIMGWLNDKFNLIKNRQGRSAGGAYEEPLQGGRGRPSNRGFGPLDPDEAWDARVGNESDFYGPGGHYEEQELGLHSGAQRDSAYGGRDGGLGAAPPSGPTGYGDDGPRGRSRSRDAPPGFIGGSQGGLDERYEEETRGGTRQDPFGDGAERSELSLRGVSPRPVELAADQSKSSHDWSPTERRSMFKENM
ncbi:MAG: hypothetical protein M1837_004681 [Sclerophora amabilis]|nr:MAG: hypothetical protein M1837_004681 [Sclerophora amabilis]